MDQIISALLKAEPFDPKHEHVCKQIAAKGSQGQSKKDILAVFKVTVEHMMLTSDPKTYRAAQELYLAWANGNKRTHLDYCTPEYVEAYLQNYSRNIERCLELLNHMLNIVLLESGRDYKILCSVVEGHIPNLVKDFQQCEPLLCFCNLLLNHKECIPKNSTLLPFCNNIFYNISNFSFTDEPSVALNMMNEFSNLVGGLMGHIWTSMDESFVNSTLQTLLDILKTVGDTGFERKDPSLALAGVIQFVPQQVIPSAVCSVVMDQSISEEMLMVIVGRILRWISWPYVNHVDRWAIMFLDDLVAAKKSHLVAELIDNNIGQLFKNLYFQATRQCSMKVVQYMLLTAQDSPDTFHKIADSVPHLVSHLHMEECNARNPKTVRMDAHLTLKALAEIMHCMMTSFPGFPDLYTSILQSIQHIARPTDDRIQELLLLYRRGNVNASNLIKTQDCTTAMYSKSATGKIGLLNLGNSCFMNACIQSLFMCDTFRNGVIQASAGTDQQILRLLQVCFAFLAATQRPVINPQNLYQASLPPWFTAYHQQDYAEYLRYLLEQLDETEAKHNKAKSTSDAADESASPGGSSSTTVMPTLIQRTFIGSVVNTYKCLRCLTESTHSESFIDLPLAFPDEQHEGIQPSNSSGASTDETSQAAHASSHSHTLSLPLMLNNYLKVERLERKNQYECDHCHTFQDAERWIQIAKAPEYLILTLLRFSYDSATQVQSKIFADVKYPKTLFIPVVSQEGKNAAEGKTATEAKTATSAKQKSRKKSPGSPSSSMPDHSRVKYEIYGLFAVVVHSGFTSDEGHYYCYARHSYPMKGTQVHELPEYRIKGECEVLGADTDFLQDVWYLFNDIRITYAQFDVFAKVQQTLDRDTPYVLMYKKLKAGEVTVEPRSPVDLHVMDLPMPKDLLDLVEQDNIVHSEEEEERLRKKRASSSVPSRGGWDNHQGPPGSCGGGGGGSNGFGGIDGGPKFVY